ncbi:hypothetical protein [Kribbella sp. NPDC055071]
MELIRVEFDDQELRFLRAALLDWGGPAAPTDEISVAMGFTNARLLASEAWALWKRIEAGEGLSLADWRRTLLAVEIVFVSDVVGSGLDWRLTSGVSDEESIDILRRVQRKLPRWRNSAQFGVGDDGGVMISDSERPELI